MTTIDDPGVRLYRGPVYQVEFSQPVGGMGDARRIVVTYRPDGYGRAVGEAYFVREDVVRPVAAGEFDLDGERYFLFVPGPGSVTADAVLEVEARRTVDRAEPVCIRKGAKYRG